MDFYTVLGVDQAPRKLRSIGESHELYCYFPPPLPEIIVVFCVQWPKSLPEKMVLKLFLDSENDSICKIVGEISQNAKAFCFKSDWNKEEQSIADEIQSKGRLIKLLAIPSDSTIESMDSQDSGISDMVSSSLDSGFSPVSKKNNKKVTENKCSKKIFNAPPLMESKQTPKRAGPVKRKSLFDFDEDGVGEDCKKLAKTGGLLTKTANNRDKSNENIEKPLITPKKKDEPITKFFARQRKTPVNKKSNNALATSPATPGFSDLKVPSPRWGHTFCQAHGNKAIIIGGQGIRNQICKDSVWQYDFGSKCFERMPEDSNGASRRMGHTATYDEKTRQIFVFGGSKSKRWYSDVHVFNIDTLTWHSIEPTGKPPVRAYHSCTLVHNELLIFGGVFPNPDPVPDGCSNDVYFFNTESHSWYQPIVSGEKPSSRSGHSACLYDGLLYIFGGWDAPSCFNDLWTLDIGLMSFKRIEVTGNAPSPRSWHGATMTADEQSMIVYGGYNGSRALNDVFIFRMASKNWSLVKDNNLIARAGHQLLNGKSRPEEEEDSILVFGGGNNEGDFFNDLTELHPAFFT